MSKDGYTKICNMELGNLGFFSYFFGKYWKAWGSQWNWMLSSGCSRKMQTLGTKSMFWTKIAFYCNSKQKE